MLLYIQGTDGMQTARSSGELADRSTRWWFIQTLEEQLADIRDVSSRVNNLTVISVEMEKEMSKFRLTETE